MVSVIDSQRRLQAIKDITGDKTISLYRTAESIKRVIALQGRSDFQPGDLVAGLRALDFYNEIEPIPAILGCIEQRHRLGIGHKTAAMALTVAAPWVNANNTRETGRAAMLSKSLIHDHDFPRLPAPARADLLLTHAKLSDVYSKEGQRALAYMVLVARDPAIDGEHRRSLMEFAESGLTDQTSPAMKLVRAWDRSNKRPGAAKVDLRRVLAPRAPVVIDFQLRGS